MFGVIFFPDIDAGLAELIRAARPGGNVCVATWRLDEYRLLRLIGDALERALPDFVMPAPELAWAHIGDSVGLGAALEAAGLADVEVHTVTHPWRWPDSADFFRRLPQWAPPVQPLFATLDDDTIDRAAAAFSDVVEEASDSAGGIDTDALIGIGRRP